MAVNPYINVPYDPSSWIGIRFCDNFTFALKKDIGDRTGDRAPNWRSEAYYYSSPGR